MKPFSIRGIRQDIPKPAGVRAPVSAEAYGDVVFQHFLYEQMAGFAEAGCIVSLER